MSRTALGISVLLHFLFLLLTPYIVGIEIPAPGSGPLVGGAPQPAIIDLVLDFPASGAPEAISQPTRPVEEEAFQVPQAPRPNPLQSGPVTGPMTPGPGGDGPPSATPGVPGGTTRGGGLRPGYSDSRLYIAPRPLPNVDKTEHQRYMEHLQARIDAVNDSMNVASNRDRNTADWTLTDGSGRRWGLSPDGLHLGGITVPRALLPLPAATGDNQSQETQRERQRQREEIRNQADDAARAQTEQERLEAIREQQDRQRANGAGSSSNNDSGSQ